MHSKRRLMAFMSGLVMYGAAVMLAILVFDMGLVELLTPQVGGRMNARIAVTGVVAVINFSLALAWAYSVLKVPQGSRRPMTAWCLSGVGVAWLGATLAGTFNMAATRGDKALLVADVLLSPAAAPFWGPVNIVVVVMAVTVAGAWALRTVPAPRRRRTAMA